MVRCPVASTVVFHGLVEDKNRGQEPRSKLRLGSAVENRGQKPLDHGLAPLLGEGVRGEGPRSRTAVSSHWTMVFLPSFVEG